MINKVSNLKILLAEICVFVLILQKYNSRERLRLTQARLRS